MTHPGGALPRRKSIAVKVGAITIGGDAPVVVQSMTNTDTADADATAKQIQQLAAAGSELVRVTVNTEAAAAQVARMQKLLSGEILELDCHFSASFLKAVRDTMK